MSELVLPGTFEGRTVRLVAAYSGYDVSKAVVGDCLSLALPDQPSISGVNTISKYIASSGALKAQLLGNNAEEQAQVSEWLSWCHLEMTPLTDQRLEKVNEWLLTRTFLVGSTLTLADLLVFSQVHEAVVNFPVAQHVKFANLLRWYDFISHTADKEGLFPRLSIAKPKFKPPPPPAPQAKPAAKTDAKGGAAPATNGATNGTAPATAKGKVGTASAPAPAPAATASTASNTTTAAAAESSEGAAQGGKKDKKEKKEKKEAKPKEDKKGGGDKKGDDEARIDMLDIRVGQIVEVGKHPNADALYLEKIDVGEAEPRQVISGLVRYVPIDKMQNRRVLVVCNLKPAKMRDVMSYGMVLCASVKDNDNEQCDPVLVPEGASLGERIQVPGYDNAPLEEINPKKKILEKLFPDMKTDADGNVVYKGAAFMTSQGPVTATIPSAWVK